MIFKKYSHLIISILIIFILIIVYLPYNKPESFSINKKVNEDKTLSQQSVPNIAIDKKNIIHFVWLDHIEATPAVYYAKSVDRGVSFSSGKRVGDLDGIEGVNIGPSVAVDGSENIYIVCYTLIEDIYNIYLSTSIDKGESFKTKFNIADKSEAHQVAVDVAAYETNNIYAVWMDNRDGPDNWNIYFAKSTDGGSSFSTNIKINDDSGTALQSYPSIEVDSKGTIHIIWDDQRNGDYDIYSAKSDNGGVSFSKNILIADGINSNQTKASITVDTNDNLYVTYSDDRNENSDIYFTKSTDSGNSWINSVKVNENISNTTQIHSSIAVDSTGKIYIVWADNRNHVNDIYSDIYMANSTNGGISFGLNEKVNDDISNNGQGNNHGSAKLAISLDDKVCIVWADNRENNWDIYFSQIIYELNLSPYLFNGTVSPITGFGLDYFEFSVTYFDVNNDRPIDINVNIIGPLNGNYTMRQANSADVNYIDGKVYIYNTTLIKGTYSYFFTASDGKFWSKTKLIRNELIIRNNPPSLTSDGVSPVSGFKDTTFNFTVKYQDKDDDLPSIITVNITGPSGGNFLMTAINDQAIGYPGKISFYYSTTLIEGPYLYHFAAFDGEAWSETQEHYGPAVGDQPILTTPNVFPKSGDSDQQFEFTVNYVDANNDLPIVITLNITGPSGGIFKMKEVNKNDTDVTNSKTYFYNNQLEPGNYSFHFATTDNNVDWIETVEIFYPIVVEQDLDEDSNETSDTNYDCYLIWIIIFGIIVFIIITLTLIRFIKVSKKRKERKKKKIRKRKLKKKEPEKRIKKKDKNKMKKSKRKLSSKKRVKVKKRKLKVRKGQ